MSYTELLFLMFWIALVQNGVISSSKLTTITGATCLISWLVSSTELLRLFN